MRPVYLSSAMSYLLISGNKVNNDAVDLSVQNTYDSIDCIVNKNPDNIYTENNDAVRLSFERKDTLKLYYFKYGN